MSTPSTPLDTKALRAAVEQISESLSEMQAARIQINETLKAAQDKFKIPAKTLRRVALMYHRQNAAEVQTEVSEVNELYKKITSA